MSGKKHRKTIEEQIAVLKAHRDRARRLAKWADAMVEELYQEIREQAGQKMMKVIEGGKN